VRDFAARFHAAYGARPDALAALGHDAAALAFDAVARAGSASGAALREALDRTRAFPGVTGPIAFDAHHDAVKPGVILCIQGDRAVYVATVAP
jgi:branched-chain amino acid transport system substrate-binding protein